LDYAVVKAIHLAAAALSFAGFFARGLASLAGAAWVQSRAARSVPHVVDTVLLASALVLAGMLRLNPFVTPWLMAKIGALVVYIGLGVVALRPRQRRWIRVATWLSALCVFGYIVLVAVTKNPLALFAGP
jgi:uncharacterized membrane protein SirB2